MLSRSSPLNFISFVLFFTIVYVEGNAQIVQLEESCIYRELEGRLSQIFCLVFFLLSGSVVV